MKRSKWDLLKLIEDHAGRMTWYPIDTFFPMGSIIEDANANGMDFVGDFLADGLIASRKNEKGEDCFSITGAGQKALAEHACELTSVK